jgi:hypothetical protein
MGDSDLEDRPWQYCPLRALYRVASGSEQRVLQEKACFASSAQVDEVYRSKRWRVAVI